MFHEYPRVMYHQAFGERLVTTPEERVRLARLDWADIPFPPRPPDPPPQPIESRLAAIEARLAALELPLPLTEPTPGYAEACKPAEGPVEAKKPKAKNGKP